MRICLVSEYFYPDNAGGTGTVLSNLVRHLKDTYDDVEIDVITSNKMYRGEQRVLDAKQDWNGVHIRRLNTPKAHATSVKKRLASNLRFAVAALRELLKGRRYDLLLISTAPPILPLAAKAFRRMTGTPYAYVVYDLYPDIAVALDVLKPQSRPARTLRDLQRGWLHAASKTIVLGRCMADHLERAYGVAHHRIEVIPIGADAGAIVPASRETAFRAANGLEGFVVLWAGNFGQHQNFDAILDAAATLQKVARAGGPRVTFAFVGDGAKRAHIAARIAGEQLDNARMFPFVPEAQFSDMLASADVSLVALEPGAEGLGVPSKFYNILASGRPTVALVAPDSEVARVLEEYNCGVRVEQDGEQLARVLLKMVDCADGVAEMGANARRACEEKYSMDEIGRQFHRVLREVAQRGNDRRGGERRRSERREAAQRRVERRSIERRGVSQRSSASSQTRPRSQNSHYGIGKSFGKSKSRA